jgi:hypothetical protein
MFGQIGRNRSMTVPLILVALAAVGIAGFRVMKAAERNRMAAQGASTQAAQAAEASCAAQTSSAEGVSALQSERLGIVLVANRDPFSHGSLFTGSLDEFGGGAPSASGDLDSGLGGTPFGQLEPFAPLVGPSSGTGLKEQATGADGAGSAGSAGPPEQPDPGFALASIIAGERPLAIITDSGGNKFFASEGEAVGRAYKVESIHSRSVVLASSKGRISLWLDAASRGDD